jgi:hypothetical protein
MSQSQERTSFESCRPAPQRRAFISPAVEEQISEVASGIGDPQLAWLFANCYRNTRQFVLSPANPWFFAGRAGSGVGSPHMGWGRVWPIAIAMRGLTSDDPAEVADCLRLLRDTHAGTGFMNESFDADDPAHFSRTWFAWANSLFGELVLQAWRRFPQVLM